MLFLEHNNKQDYAIIIFQLIYSICTTGRKDEMSEST